MKVELKDNSGRVVAEIESSQFPLHMPIKTRLGDKDYYLHIYYEPDDKETARSALLNTRP